MNFCHTHKHWYSGETCEYCRGYKIDKKLTENAEKDKEVI